MTTHTKDQLRKDLPLPNHPTMSTSISKHARQEEAIQRYDSGDETNPEMTLCSDGEFVRHEDHLRAIDSATAAKEREIEGLKICLSVATTQMEQFERNWYLRGDEIDDLQACLATLNEERGSFIAFANTLPTEGRPLLVGPIQVARWHIEALQARVRELQEVIENAKSAFGEHPDTEMDLSERISQLRDENREWFHKYTQELNDAPQLDPNNNQAYLDDAP